MGEIRGNLVYLTQNIDNVSTILLYLIQEDIISENESNEIESEKTPLLKKKELLMLLQRKDWNYIKTKFLEILRQTKNGECANVMEGLTSTHGGNSLPVTERNPFNLAIALGKGGRFGEAVTILEELFMKVHNATTPRSRTGETAALRILDTITLNKTINLEEAKRIEEGTTATEIQVAHLLLHFYVRLGRTQDARKIVSKTCTLSHIMKTICSANIPNYYLEVKHHNVSLGLTELTKTVEITSTPLDISCLPRSVEKLHLFHLLEKELLPCGRIDLPNLKYLRMEGMPSSSLALFQSVPLTTIQFVGMHQVDLTFAPPTLKNIQIKHLQNCKTGVIVGKSRQLDKVVLEEFPLDAVVPLLTHLHPKLLVIHGEYQYEPQQLNRLLTNPLQTVAIGTVFYKSYQKTHWTNRLNLNRPVVLQPAYYLADRGNWKAIHIQQFHELL